MADFRDILALCDVFNIGFAGALWTFDNRQLGDKNVKVRLDRALASASWSNWFPEARLCHLVSSRSDNVPILLEMTIDESEKRPTRFARYEIMWERDQALPDEIRSARHACTAVHDLGDISGNLKKVMSNLSNWSREKFGGVTHELEKLRKRMEELISRINAVDRKELEQIWQWMDELLFRE
jgi:hypothetical protein